MWIIEGIIAGVISGILMGVATEIGYRIGLVRSNLVVIDGSFALRMLKRADGTVAVYVLGIIIHLVTSLVFGIVYVVIARLADFDPRLISAVTVYVFILWLAMLAVALPVAGQGFMGSRIRRCVWLEQLVLHAIFGLSFWWALGII
jgi:uncharacterized membrane protein YagU involved in acid resistance